MLLIKDPNQQIADFNLIEDSGLEKPPIYKQWRRHLGQNQNYRVVTRDLHLKFRTH